MSRNRMIKPEFWSSESLMRVSRESRLLFIGLWNFCDDYGFCLDNSRRIVGDIFPLDENVTQKMVEKWLDELSEIKVVLRGHYCGKKLIYINSWDEHQYVQHPSKRTYVEPEEMPEIIDILRDSCNPHETLLSVSHTNKKEKVKEKEKEKGFVSDFDDYWNELKVATKSRNKRVGAKEKWDTARKAGMTPEEIVKAWNVYKSGFEDPLNVGGFNFQGKVDDLKGWIEENPVDSETQDPLYTQQWTPEMLEKARQTLKKGAKCTG